MCLFDFVSYIVAVDLAVAGTSISFFFFVVLLYLNFVVLCIAADAERISIAKRLDAALEQVNEIHYSLFVFILNRFDYTL